MICFDQENKVFYLENEHVTYAFRVAYGHLEHLYFGAKIGHDDLSYTRTVQAQIHDAWLGEKGDKYTLNHLSNEMPTYGNGDYREPMLVYENEAGDTLSELRYSHHRIIPEAKVDGMPFTFGGESLEVYMVDDFHKVEVVLTYTVFPDTDAITRTCRITNRGEGVIRLGRAYSFSFDLPTNQLDVVSLYGAWASERNMERTPIHHGVFSIDSKRTSSSAALNPFLAICEKDATETHGRVWGVNLVYPSSYRLFVEGTQNGRTRVGGGINDFCFSWKLTSGEALQTPEVVLVFSNEGLGGMSRIYHDTYREHLINQEQVKAHRPLVINNWEATYFDFDNERLFAIIDACEGTGIDTFVLDDGWFGVRNDDHSGLGDWFINTDKLVGGLTPVINRCHQKGLKFGLWFEPEMVNPDSDLYREHPEWAIHCPGHEIGEHRNQFMLDLTRADVRDYIVKVVGDILDNNDISYVKWDFNRNATEMYSELLPADRQREFSHRYALGLYDVCERLIRTRPHIFFEGCSSGGARFDPAMLYYFSQSWTSDDTDAAMRARIQYGTSLCYPLSSQSCHVSVCPNHQTRRTTPLQSRADIAHLGATGYELDVSHMSEEDRAEIAPQVAQYLRMEKLVLEGDLYRLANPFGNREFAVLLVSKDKTEAHLTFMQLLRVVNCEPLFLRLQGLDPDALYHIEELDKTLHGSTLMELGLHIPNHRMADFETLTYHIHKV